MATPFRLKRSSISGKRPLIGDLELGELALNFYDGYLFARRDTDGVGIADTVSLLNPWVENYGGSSIHYLQSVGIGTTSPSETLTVHGNSYVSGNFNTKTLTASTVTSNNGIFTSFSATGVSTFSNNLNIEGNSTFTADLDINAAIDVDGHTELDELRVSGVSTFVGVATFTDSNVYIENQLFVGGIQIDGGAGGGSSFAGIVTFTDTTNNTLGESNTGALQIDGGVGIDKNLTVGAGLSVGATLNVAGVTTFQGDVLLDGANTDLVVEGNIRTPNLHSNGSDLTIRGGGNTAAKQSIILNNSGSSAMQILGSSSSTGGITLDTRNSGNILLKHNGVTKVTVDSTGIEVNGHSELDTVRITGLSTFTKNVDVNAAIDVDGHTELDELNVAGVATFTNVTDNTLGDSNTGALQIDGGLGVDKNVTIGGNLNVQGYSELVGVVTFKGGTINIGDANTDDVNVGGEFISSLIPNDDDTYDLGSDSQQWRNIYINGQAEIDDLNVAGITTTVQFNVGVGGTVITTTETGLVGINSTAPTTTLDVDGTINSSTDVTINGTSVITTATNDAVALAIALG
tara:strand:- start:354 stop:2072 length:1719 start_codon:yes stop_codon:yes gene_type:complete